MDMNNLFDAAVIVSVLTATLRIATPLIFASLGELLSQRGGILNLGLEGTMLLSAFAAYCVSYFTGSSVIGLLAGALTGMFMNAFMSFMTVTLKLEQMVAGLATNFFGSGMSLFLYMTWFGGRSPTIIPLDETPIPLLSEIPYLGDIFFHQQILTYLALALVPGVWYLLFRTRFGLELRSIGENPKVADTKGLSVPLRQYAAMLIGGALIGLGGSFLTIASAVRFVPEISAGRGWLALVIVIAGNWKPGGILIACIAFSFLDALQLQIQGVGLQVPYQLMLALPYVVAIVLMVLKRNTSEEPARLGVPYFRGER